MGWITRDHRQILVESVRLLAANAEEQKRAFPDFVELPDELALTFDDAYTMLAVELLKDGLITETQKAKLDQIDSLLAEMTLDKSIWTLEHVYSSAKWQAARELAAEALLALGEMPGAPNLSWAQFVPTTPPFGKRSWWYRFCHLVRKTLG